MARRPAKVKKASAEVESIDIAEISNDINKSNMGDEEEVPAIVNKKRTKKIANTKEKSDKLPTEKKAKTPTEKKAKIDKIETNSSSDIVTEHDNIPNENTKPKKRQAKNTKSNADEVVTVVSNGKGDELEINDKPKSKGRGRKAKATEENNTEVEDKPILEVKASKPKKINSKKVTETESTDIVENNDEEPKQKGRKAKKKEPVTEESDEPPTKKKSGKKTEKEEPKKSSKTKKEQPNPEPENHVQEPASKRKRKAADDKGK